MGEWVNGVPFTFILTSIATDPRFLMAVGIENENFLFDGQSLAAGNCLGVLSAKTSDHFLL